MDVAVPLKQFQASAIMAARPTLAADGVDITTWPVKRPAAFTVFLSNDAAATVTGPGGVGTGPECFGYRADLGKWFMFGYLNRNQAITIPAAADGYAEIVQYAGLFDRLAIVCTASAGVALAAIVEPVETRA